MWFKLLTIRTVKMLLTNDLFLKLYKLWYTSFHYKQVFGNVARGGVKPGSQDDAGASILSQVLG